MQDTQRQTAAGKVLCHFTMSLDGFVAGPADSMDWMNGLSVRPGLIEEYVETTGAIIAGRRGWDAAIERHRPYGGLWSGPIFVMTHHPEDAQPTDNVTFLDCELVEAVRTARRAAGGKNVEVFSPTIGAQLLAAGLVDELDLHIAPVLLGDGVRLYGDPAAPRTDLDRIGSDDPTAVVNVRYAPRPPRATEDPAAPPRPRRASPPPAR